MKIKNMNVALLALFALASCSQGQSKDKPGTGDDIVVLQGTVQNPASGHIILEEVQGNNVVPVDTFTLGADNTFKENLTVKEPGFYRLNFYGKKMVNLVLDDENVQITADIENAEQPKVEGSKDTEYLQQINAVVMNSQQKVRALEEEYIKARNEQNAARMKELEERYLELEYEKKEQVKDKLRNMESSIAQVYGISYLSQEEDFPFLDSLSNRLQKDLPDSKYVKDFTQGVNNMRSTVVGATAPEISLPNPQGETKNLSDLRGNVVLIDFWAAWCGPCRRENPNVVKAYNKYNSKGFEVFGVSLDRNREDWVKAIEKDGLVWTQVSDLKYFNSEAAQKYNINAIPATILLDRDGKIIARNLRGAALEEKLEEILGE